MAELNARIIAKASATASEEPQAADLEVAELAVNTADGKLFTKHTDGSIVTISGGGGGGAVDSVNGQTGVVSLASRDLTDVTINNTSLDNGTWSTNVGAGGPVGNGQWSYYVNAPTYILRLYFYDSSGVRRDAALIAMNAGDELQYSPDGVTWYSFNLDSSPTLEAGGQIHIDLIESVYNEMIVNMPTSGSVYLRTPTGLDISDGQVLTWVAANSRWEPADAAAGGVTQIVAGTNVTIDPVGGTGAVTINATGGGGGAVDSVNGQTGVVVLDLEDLNNCGLPPDPSASSFNLSGPTTSNPSAPGEWGLDPALNNYFTWYTSDPIHAWINALTVGESVEFVTQGGYTHVGVITTASTVNGANSNYISFANDPWPQELLDAKTNNESITVQEVGAGFLQPTDGQVLTWVAANSQWEPADGGGGGGAVNSVNGQTGTVSLGVQDMDDFALLIAQGGQTWSGTWTIHTLVDNQCAGAGQIGPGVDFGNGFNVSVTDGDGVNRSAQIDALANGSLWFKINNGAWAEATTGGIGSACDPVTKLMGCADLHAAIDAAQVGDTVTIGDGQPVSGIPLAEGEILRWNNTDQKFNPAVLQLDGLTDVDTSTTAPTDGQVLAWVDANNQWEPTTPSGGGATVLPFDAILKYTYGNANNSGEWQYWSNFGANDLYINPVDNTGIDATAMFEHLDRSNPVTNIWHSSDSGATWTRRKGNTFAKSPGVVFYVFDSATGETFFNGDQWFTFADPRQPNRISSNADVDTVTTPPTDGQVLTWVNANNQWEPGDYISKATLQAEVAASTDFADFQSRIAAL